MLVEIVETAEHRQGQIRRQRVERSRPATRLKVCPTVVWLQGFDDCSVLDADADKIFPLLAPVVVPVVEDRKLRGSGRSRTPLPELPRQMVEGAAEIVDYVSHNEAKSYRNTSTGLPQSESDHLIPGLDLRLDGNAIRVPCKPG